MAYRCVATTVEGFVQQVAVSYVANGYFFYVAGSVPANKDPAAVDAKIIDRYGIAISKWAKARRKALGQANLQYIRHERFFLILATHGTHAFFEEEARVIRDVRRVPIRFAGYSISFRNGHASVRIEPTEYRMLKSFFEDLALRRTLDSLQKEFRAIPFEPYAPVRRQLLGILRSVNRKRRLAGFESVPLSALSLSRSITKPFASDAGKTVKAPSCDGSRCGKGEVDGVEEA